MSRPHHVHNIAEMQLPPTSRLLAVVAALAVLLAACGGGDGDGAETAGVASVDDLDETTTDAVDAATEESDAAEIDPVDAEEIVLAMSQCMRDNGWDDFPDPVPDGNGGFGLRDAILSSGINFQDPAFREQLDVCQVESGADQLGTGARNNNREALQEQLLVYTDCLRAEGLDVGDLSFDGGGGQGAGTGQAQADNDGANRGQPQGDGGAGGDRAARIANNLGLDLDAPDVTAALDACEATLEEVLAGFGQGGAGRQPATDNS